MELLTWEDVDKVIADKTGDTSSMQYTPNEIITKEESYTFSAERNVTITSDLSAYADNECIDQYEIDGGDDPTPANLVAIVVEQQLFQPVPILKDSPKITKIVDVVTTESKVFDTLQTTDYIFICECASPIDESFTGSGFSLEWPYISFYRWERLKEKLPVSKDQFQKFSQEILSQNRSIAGLVEDRVIVHARSRSLDFVGRLINDKFDNEYTYSGITIPKYYTAYRSGSGGGKEITNNDWSFIDAETTAGFSATSKIDSSGVRRLIVTCDKTKKTGTLYLKLKSRLNFTCDDTVHFNQGILPVELYDNTITLEFDLNYIGSIVEPTKQDYTYTVNITDATEQPLVTIGGQGATVTGSNGNYTATLTVSSTTDPGAKSVSIERGEKPTDWDDVYYVTVSPTTQEIVGTSDSVTYSASATQNGTAYQWECSDCPSNGSVTATQSSYDITYDSLSRFNWSVTSGFSISGNGSTATVTADGTQTSGTVTASADASDGSGSDTASVTYREPAAEDKEWAYTVYATPTSGMTPNITIGGQPVVFSGGSATLVVTSSTDPGPKSVSISGGLDEYDYSDLDVVVSPSSDTIDSIGGTASFSASATCERDCKKWNNVDDCDSNSSVTADWYWDLEAEESYTGSFSWSVSGPFSIDQSGNVTSTGEGSGTVTASVADFNGLSGSGTASVECVDNTSPTPTVTNTEYVFRWTQSGNDKTVEYNYDGSLKSINQADVLLSYKTVTYSDGTSTQVDVTYTQESDPSWLGTENTSSSTRSASVTYTQAESGNTVTKTYVQDAKPEETETWPDDDNHKYITVSGDPTSGESGYTCVVTGEYGKISSLGNKQKVGDINDSFTVTEDGSKTYYYANNSSAYPNVKDTVTYTCTGNGGNTGDDYNYYFGFYGETLGSDPYTTNLAATTGVTYAADGSIIEDQGSIVASFKVPLNTTINAANAIAVSYTTSKSGDSYPPGTNNTSSIKAGTVIYTQAESGEEIELIWSQEAGNEDDGDVEDYVESDLQLEYPAKGNTYSVDVTHYQKKANGTITKIKSGTVTITTSDYFGTQDRTLTSEGVFDGVEYSILYVQTACDYRDVTLSVYDKFQTQGDEITVSGTLSESCPDGVRAWASGDYSLNTGVMSGWSANLVFGAHETDTDTNVDLSDGNPKSATLNSYGISTNSYWYDDNTYYHFN